MKYLFLVPVMALVLVGCKPLYKEVNPDGIPQTGSKLVVHSFISPQDTALLVKVSVSRNVLGESVPFYRLDVMDANVELSDGAHSVNLTYDFPSGGYYKINAKLFPIQEGKTYTLKVGRTGGTAVQAQTTVPYAVPLQRLEIDTLTVTSFVNGKIRMYWNDVAKQANYYSVDAKVNYDMITSVRTGAGVLKDTLMHASQRLRFDEPFLTDQGFDGQPMASPRQEFTIYPSYYGSSPRLLRPILITAYLLHLDSNYYKYQKAVEEWNNDNPFAEPVLIPSNIQGGLGCFGSYSRAEFTGKIGN